MAWREELHPRDARGQFAAKGTDSGVTLKQVMSAPQDATVEDLLDAFHRVSRRKKPDAKALRMIDAELARREQRTELAPPDADKDAAKVDTLVGRGWSYVDAYAEVYGGSVEKMRASEERAALGARPGERTETARRRAYREMVSLQYLQAEEATRGVLLTKRCAVQGVDPRSLWSAAPARAARCASDELKAWWEAQGGRMSYATFRSYSGGSQSRATARAKAGAGAGRDYGV
jgi:hypothetical protein